MPGAMQPSADAAAEKQIRPLVRARSFGGDDPLTVSHEKEVVSADGDRHQGPAVEHVGRAEANSLRPFRLSHRDKLPAHAGPR